MVMAPNGTLITEDIARRTGRSRNPADQHQPGRRHRPNARRVPQGCRAPLTAHCAVSNNQAGRASNFRSTPPSPRPISIKSRKSRNWRSSSGPWPIISFCWCPTGRGKYIVDQAITAEEYEHTLNWFYDQRDKTPLQLKATCAPHYYRILRQRADAQEGKPCRSRHPRPGCRHPRMPGGIGVLFHLPSWGRPALRFPLHVSRERAQGIVRTTSGNTPRSSPPCGTTTAWRANAASASSRRVCGGCRARAFEATGDYLAEEPLCSHIPHRAC